MNPSYYERGGGCTLVTITLSFAVAMCYKLLIVGEGKYFGLTTACLYVNVGGENGESGVLMIPKGDYQLEFTVRLIKQYTHTHTQSHTFAHTHSHTRSHTHTHTLHYHQ